MTSTDVANKAINENLGVPTIDDIDDVEDPSAVNAKKAYEPARKLYLRMADPSFARKEVALALATGETSIKYDYVYGYPAGGLFLREIWNGTTNNDPRIEYEIGLHSSGSSNVILTDQADAVIFQTVDVTNLNLWQPDDITALALLWAMNLAMPLKRDRQLRLQMREEYLAALAIAKTNNKRNQYKKLPDHDRYLTARR